MAGKPAAKKPEVRQVVGATNYPFNIPKTFKPPTDPKADPWVTQVEQWLAVNGMMDFATADCLFMLGIDWDDQTTDHGRRLKTVMGQIDKAWKQSTNIPIFNSRKRLRGWKLLHENWKPRRLKRNFAEEC